MRQIVRYRLNSIEGVLRPRLNCTSKCQWMRRRERMQSFAKPPAVVSSERENSLKRNGIQGAGRKSGDEGALCLMRWCLALGVQKGG
jgi:hypothetical protein